MIYKLISRQKRAEFFRSEELKVSSFLNGLWNKYDLKILYVINSVITILVDIALHFDIFSVVVSCFSLTLICVIRLNCHDNAKYMDQNVLDCFYLRSIWKLDNPTLLGKKITLINYTHFQPITTLIEIYFLLLYRCIHESFSPCSAFVYF